MVNRNALIWMFVLLISIVSISAVSTPINYWPGDTDGTNFGTNSQPLQHNGTATGISTIAMVGEGAFRTNLSGSGWSNGNMTELELVRSISYWIRPDDDDISDQPHFQMGDGAGKYFYCISATHIHRCKINHAAASPDFNTNNIMEDDPSPQWTHVALTYGPGGFKVWHNGTAGTTDAYAENASDLWRVFTLGLGELAHINASQNIDEFYMFNSTGNISWAQELYNAGINNYTYYNYTAPITTIDNMSVTVQSDNGVVINGHNFTLNGILYTGNSSSTSTNVSGNVTSFNITASAIGFFDRTWSSQTSNETWTANLTPKPLTAALQWNYTTPLLTNTNLTVNYTLTNHTLNISNVTITFWNENEDIGYNLSMYLINSSDLFDSIVVGLETCNAYTCNTSLNLSTGSDSIDTNFVFNALNTVGAHLPSMQWIFQVAGFNSTVNPLTQLASVWLNTTLKSTTETINITDLTYFNRPNFTSFEVNENTTNYTFTVEPVQLALSFVKKGVLTNTFGSVYDTNKTQGFYNTSVVIVQSSLLDGPVQVKFNQDNSSGVPENHTQYYEYINTQTTHIAETVELLDLFDTTFYFKVTDAFGKNIPGATVRMYFARPEVGNTTELGLMGQRLTDGDGSTFFFGDTGTDAAYIVTAPGYTQKEGLIAVGDEANGEDNPIPIVLDVDDTRGDPDVWVYISSEFSNATITQSGTMVAINKAEILLGTNYTNAPNITLTGTGDDLGRYDFELIPNTHFAASDYLLYIWTDGLLSRTIRVEYNPDEPNQILDFRTQDVPNSILIIALIMISALMALMFSSPDAGAFTFLGGSILLGFVSTSMLWLSLISVIYFIFRMTNEVRRE